MWVGRPFGVEWRSLCDFWSIVGGVLLMAYRALGRLPFVWWVSAPIVSDEIIISIIYIVK